MLNGVISALPFLPLLLSQEGAAALPADAAAQSLPAGIGLSHYLVVSALVFGFGIMVIITRRNAIALLIGLELILNSVGLNFVAFAKFVTRDPLDGQVVTLFLIVIAAAEASLALAITLNLFNSLNTIEVDEARTLKG